MRLLSWGLTAAVAVWGVWWWIAATAMERAAEAWFAGLRAAGWQAEAQDASVMGFPARLDLTVTAPALFDPLSGTGWSGPFAQILTLAYRPWHVIAALPPEQVLTIRGTDLRLTADRLRASVVATPLPALPLDRTAVEGDGLRLALPLGALTIDILRAGTRANGGAARHDVALALRGMTTDLPLPPEAPTEPAELRLDATLTFDAPLDRHAGATRPAITAVTLHAARLSWGSLQGTATGTLERDAAGFAAGRINLTLDDWPRALALAVAAGLIDPGVAPTWAAIAERLSDADGTPGRLALPLTLAGGRATLGPLPIGRAPRL
jgi:hypothetical protein